MSIEQTIDAYITAEMERQHLPGLSLAVIDHGEPVLIKGYGFANLELGVPATPDTVYEIASLTKQFTATAIMILVEEGKVKLTDPVSHYDQRLPAEWQAITLHHLLSHTSGIHYWSVDWSRTNLTIEDLYKDAYRLPLQFSPGAQYGYCDVNYNILGMVIHQVTGKPYHEFLRDRVFAPLGMKARQNDWRAIVPNRANGYCWEDREWKNCQGIQWHPLSDTTPTAPINGANGSLLCCASDLVKWDAALYTEQIITQATRRQMWTPTILTEPKAGFGLGWWIEEQAGQWSASHGGMNPAFGVWYGRYLDANLGIAVLTNCAFGPQGWVEESSPNPVPIGKRIAELYQSISVGK